MRMVKRMDVVANVTVNEVVDWCLQRGLNPNAVTVTTAHLKWESPETEEEAERRVDWEEQRNHRQEIWERQTYERLREKYREDAP